MMKRNSNTRDSSKERGEANRIEPSESLNCRNSTCMGLMRPPLEQMEITTTMEYIPQMMMKKMMKKLKTQKEYFNSIRHEVAAELVVKRVLVKGVGGAMPMVEVAVPLGIMVATEEGDTGHSSSYATTMMASSTTI